MRQWIALGSLYVVASLCITGASRADTIYLRTPNCTGIPAPCKTNLKDVLHEIQAPTGGRSLPSPTNPVLVDIGPGVFSLTSTAYSYCGPVGSTQLSNLSFRGSGKENTILTGGGYSRPNQEGASYVVWVNGCSAVNFDDLTIQADGTTAVSGALFEGNGGIRWSNVRILAQSFAYYDQASSGKANSVHYWYNSELIANGSSPPSIYTVAFYANGSTHWFHGSQFVANVGNLTFAIIALADFELHIYGSRITSTSVGSGWGIFTTPTSQESLLPYTAIPPVSPRKEMRSK